MATPSAVLRTLFWTGPYRSRLIVGLLFYPICLAPFVWFWFSGQASWPIWIGIVVSFVSWIGTWVLLWRHAERYADGLEPRGRSGYRTWTLFLSLLGILGGWAAAFLVFA